MYAISCHDRGHANFMLVFQSCTDSLQFLPGLSNKKYATPSDGLCNSSSIEVEEDVDVIEEGFTAVNKEVDIGIKREEIPENMNFSGIMSEPDEVSSVFVCVSVGRQILPESRNISFFFCDVSISGKL